MTGLRSGTRFVNKEFAASGACPVRIHSLPDARSSTLRVVLPEPSARLLEVLEEIERETGGQSSARTLALPADVRDPQAVRAAADRLREEFGHIDVMIANAGVGATTEATELEPLAVA